MCQSSSSSNKRAEIMDDPFISNPPSLAPQRESHRYSSFGSQLLTLNASSPSQVKRALEAHLAETERRLQDASKLGTALVQQQKDLSDKLREIEGQQDEGEIGPELRRKLADLEKEYNEIGRESARASLGPKSRLIADEDGGTPSRDGRTPASPAVLSSQATSSPSKVSVPSRRQRNQQSSRVHDIEFATEISTSLLAQVRQLQALLVERDDTLKAVNLEKSRLELEAEGFSQRLRALDENEQRYKDENWTLETQTQELLAEAKEAAAREAQLKASLDALTSEKSQAQQKIDELKQVNEKLIEDNTATQKTYDSELHILRRNVNVGDVERNTLQQKVEELTSQNQELAKAVASKLRQHESQASRDNSPTDEADESDESTPENSPPASPNKATPRHGHLETETLRSSLHHAHRMIQNLKSNIHREKTEKIELKRMLQEARDEVEQQRRVDSNGPTTANKRQKKKDDVFKKPPRPEMLGARRALAEIEIEEPEWEDHTVEASPTRKGSVRCSSRYQPSHARTESVETSDAYQTANETEGFETANERETATESEAFQTGAESLAGDTTEEELTETESRAPSAVVRGKKPLRLPSNRPGDRTSFMSTASSSDEDEDEHETRTPIQAQPQRYRLKMNRGRRGRPSGGVPESGDLSPRNSPATSFSHPRPMIVPSGQSLFAELEELQSPDSGSEFGTPRRSNTVSQTSTPILSRFADQRRPSEAPSSFSVSNVVVMVDSGMMTEPWEAPRPDPVAPSTPTTAEPSPTQSVIIATPNDVTEFVDSATQYTPQKGDEPGQKGLPVSFDTPPKTIWDESIADKHHGAIPAEPKTPVLAPSPPLELQVSSIFSEETMPVVPIVEEVEQVPQTTVQLNMSTITYEETLPVVPVVDKAEEVSQPLVQLNVSAITYEETVPVVPVVEKVEEVPPPSAQLNLSTITYEETVPVVPVVGKAEEVLQPSAQLNMSTITYQETQPVTPPTTVLPTPSPLDLVISHIQAETTEPLEPILPEVVERPSLQLQISSIFAEETKPVEPQILRGVVAQASLFQNEEDVSPGRPRTAVHDKEASDRSIGDFKSVDTGTDAFSPIKELTDAANQDAATVPFYKNIFSDIVHSSVTPQVASSNPIIPVVTAENAAQTILTATQIDRLLMERSSRPDSKQQYTLPVVNNVPSSPTTPKAKPQTAPAPTDPSQTAVRRPGSASSQRRGSTASYPPLPPDHKQAIAAATQRLSSDLPPTGTMGPPLAPASAYRTNVQNRPRTPNEGSSIKNGVTPRAHTRRGSQISRRSSVSSFASELDVRFGMNKAGYAFDTGTDPRMIQAITQTMIGEFLWKYTRRTGRPDVSSNTRHQRYFWVHPYTRTLYWSDQDPQSAGKSQLKAKSVAIEAVRVVNDDNPYPPGLHQKSLEIVTPGRTVKFTASTSQRHETWFNALSYLLLRTAGEEAADRGENLTSDDINEFNPSYRNSPRPGGSRMSISSRTSRNARAFSKQYREPTLTVRQSVTPGRASPALSSGPNSTVRGGDPAARQGSVSRISSMFRNSGMGGTFSSRRSRYGGAARASMDSSSAAGRDSAEDLRQVIERQEMEADRLENVRACCDGKHDVGSLPRTSRYSSRASPRHKH
ncbi:hypothetical protein FQN50_006546 [Emmonsiellopsis sp. PD_5]|nr:hypothetical protein FQN50_006546 [Emmonsiellopsis sp. PD_5]